MLTESHCVNIVFVGFAQLDGFLAVPVIKASPRRAAACRAGLIRYKHRWHPATMRRRRLSRSKHLSDFRDGVLI
jgi:hypothetical protein